MLTRDEIEQALDYMDRHRLIRLGSRQNNGEWVQLHCPFHNNGQEKRPSCGCSLQGQTRNGITYSPGRWHCFSCGASYSFGNGIKEILALKDSSLEAHPELEQYVTESAPVEVDSLIPDDMMSSILTSYAVDNLKVRTKMKQEFVPESELATYRFTVPYMYERKLTDAIIDKYDVGFDGNFKLPGRSKPMPSVTFPVRDIKGNTLFICRRSVEGKFFHMPQGVEKPVYGIYELPSDAKEVIICESIFNALTCIAYGHPAVALLGTGTPYQMNQLKKLGCPSFVICMDNDEAGRRGVARIKRALTGSAMTWIMTVPEGKDVNDLLYDEFLECYNHRE